MVERLQQPDLTCLDGLAEYPGGHLCVHCDAAVAEVLARRRERCRRPAGAVARRAGARRAVAPERRLRPRRLLFWVRDRPAPDAAKLEDPRLPNDRSRTARAYRHVQYTR